MSERRPPASPLWGALAEAQNAALAGSRNGEALERAVSARVLQPAAPRRRRALFAVMGALAVAGAAAVVLVGVFPRRLSFQLGHHRAAGAPGRTLVAEAQSELPLRFSDGSTVTFQPGSSGRVERLTGRGAEVLLERGRLTAAVQHAADTRWLVRAGAFRIRVTGTRFDVDWAPRDRAGDGRLTVALREGSVIVDGSLLGDGVALRAGQRLQVDEQQGLVRTEPLEPAPAVATPAAAAAAPAAPVPAAVPAVAHARAPADPADDQWRQLAERGAYAEALRSAERMGLPALARRLGARDLLALGDVARYAGAPEQARRLFELLVRRYPRDRAAADAVFSLGRLAFEAGHPAVAVRWFERYLQDWPSGSLAAQAAARLREARGLPGATP